MATSRLRARAPAERAPLPRTCHPALREALGRGGIDELYAAPGRGARGGARGHTIVTTGTASGKSLAFNLPVLDTLAARPPRARALPLPDQGARPGPGAQAATSCGAPFLRQAIYDGDTPARGAPRRSGSALQPHPHQPGHAPRRGPAQPPGLGRRARQPRLDRGRRGPRLPRACSARTSANVLRRLRRLANAYGTEPRFILTSATIANPVELAERPDRARLRLVDRDGGAARRAPDRDVEPAADRRGRPARAARRCPRRPDLLATLVERGGADDLLPQVAPRASS